MTVCKMDKSTQGEWESQICKEKMPPTFKTLQQFLEQQIVMLESLHVLPNSITGNKKLLLIRECMSLTRILIHCVIWIISFKYVIYFVQKRLLIVKLLWSQRNYVLTILAITKVQCAAVNASVVSLMQNIIRCCTKFLHRMLLPLGPTNPLYQLFCQHSKSYVKPYGESQFVKIKINICYKH